jgi:hypothetical protein
VKAEVLILDGGRNDLVLEMRKLINLSKHIDCLFQIYARGMNDLTVKILEIRK